MPTWSNELPKEAKHKGFDLKRTPVSGALEGICTAENLIVCDTHFWHGRTTPCERETNEEGRTTDDTNCPACVAKAAYRTHVYLSAIHPKTREHFIFECTAHAGKPFAEYHAATGTLRGMIFHASRPKGTPNSKVLIQTNTANLARVTLPPAPDVPRALSVIWRIPHTAIDTSERPHQPPTVTTNGQVLKSLREQMENAADPPTAAEVLRAYAAEKTKKSA